MSLMTAKYVKDVGDTPLQFNLEIGWLEISKGLGLVMRGYFVLIGGSVLGALCIWLTMDSSRFTPWLDAGQGDQNDLLALGILVLGLTALFSYGLVLVGQWRCLMHAPQRQNAKELVFICLNMVLIASILNVVGVWLDGANTYAALEQGWGAVDDLNYRSAGNLAQLGSGILGLVAALVFSQFLRNVASCFGNQALVRSVDFNLGFVGLLLGGSLGTVVRGIVAVGPPVSSAVAVKQFTC